MQEIYISTDVETDGSIPGVNSMLSFGSAAYLADKTILSTFSANLEILSDASGDSKTMEWWKGEPEAWNACQQNIQDPKSSFEKYLQWLKTCLENLFLQPTHWPLISCGSIGI